MAAAVAVRKLAIQDERHGLEPAVRVRSERQSVVAGRIALRAVVVQEQERIEMFDPWAWQRPPGHEIADILADGGVLRLDGSRAH
jgi:hypothetical protein